MKKYRIIFFTLSIWLFTSCGAYHTTLTQSGVLSTIEGTWYLRSINHKDVRHARVTIDINTEQMTMHGFDGCNTIYGKLYHTEDNKTIIPQILTTRMQCRTPMHRQTSHYIHKAFEEGFRLRNTTQHDINGTSLSSQTYQLFFIPMGKYNKQTD